MTTSLRQSLLISVVFCIQLILNIEANGQQLSSYNLQYLPQRSYMNPSFMPHGKIHIGIPILSGISNSYSNNGFRYNDLLRKNDNNALVLDIENTLNHLKSRNNINIHAETEILAFGLKAGKNYFTLNVTEKGDVNFTFSKSFIEFIYKGNAATMGTVQQLNPGLESIHYREYGIAWALELSPLISTGIRVKYLYGMEHALTKGKGVTVYTDPIDYTITASTDYTIYTSGIDASSFNNTGFGNYAFGKRNKGYAMDAGITAKPIQRVEITAAVIDFGNIKWTTNNTVYHTSTQQGNFIYSGINLNEFINNDSLDAESYIESIGDSLYESFHVSNSHENYKYKMPLQLFFSVSYFITPRYKFTGLARNKNTYQGNITDYQLSFTGKSKTWLNYTVGLNKINQTPVTLGAGFTINFHNDQVYFISDNVPGMINWKKAYNTGFRAGINIMFGTRLKYMKPRQQVTGEQASAL